MSDTASLALAEEWLLSSGIQDRTVDPRVQGGVHAWFDLSTSQFSFYYTEITGYYVTWCCYEYRLTGEPKYLDAAAEAVAWLLREARDPATKALKCRLNDQGWAGRACSFDNAMCLNGLVNYYAISGDEDARTAAREIGNWLVDAMRQSDGSFFSKFDLATKAPNNPGGKWSLISGPFLIKLSIGLLALAGATGEVRFSDAARDLCTWGLQFQDSDGRVRTSPDPSITFLHPHCYAAEGWYVAGSILQNQTFLDAHRKAVEWAAAMQRPTGGFPGYSEGGKAVDVESPDITAQVYRLWQLLPVGERPNINEEAVKKNILSYQCMDDRAWARGGLFSGSAWFHGEAKNAEGQHVNSWVTMFATQALRMTERTDEWAPTFLV